MTKPMTLVRRHIAATPDIVYAAFMDPAALVQWLPPGEMTGRIHAFDGRIGGGYRMSLYYPSTTTEVLGKTAAQEDLVEVRFTDLVPPRRIAEAVTFTSADPVLQGEMLIEIDIAPASCGTLVTFLCRDLPPGLKPEDNEQGCHQSLDQLAAFLTT